MVIFKNKVNICVSVAIFGVTFFTGFTQAQNFDDTRENGPFDQRYFGRIKGIPPAVSLAPQPSVVEPSVKLIEDADGTTNELIVFLQYEKMPDLVKLMGAAGKNNSAAVVAAPELERAVIESLNNKSNKNLNDLMRSPAHARFLIEMERMTDEERLRSARSRPDRERLERFMVLRYPSVALARSAAETLSKEPTVASAKLNRVVVQSMVPNDPYFAKVGSAMPKPHYQWGAYAMNFPAAWDQARGQAQIGILDTAYFGMISYVPSTANSAAKYVVDPHPDLALNARLHFTPGAPSTVGAHDVHLHAVHVAGIIGAQSNNLNSNETLPNGKVFKGGTSGGCIGCSITAFPYLGNVSYISSGTSTVAKITTTLTRAIDTGMQIINWSGSLNPLAPGQTNVGYGCPNYNDAFCNVLGYLSTQEVLMPVSTGNFNYTVANLNSPLMYSNYYSVLPVGGTEIDVPQIGVAGSRWYYDASNGASDATVDGVVAPAKSIVSSYLAGRSYPYTPYDMCGDIASTDESGGRYPADGVGDGVGSCTGTSMAAPHVSALAGLIRSINPRLTALETRDIIKNSGNLTSNRTAALGSGLPNAVTAVNMAIATNPSRLTPLFAFYSSVRTDSFYTTVPQMAIAALTGALMPRKSMGTAGWAGSDGYYVPAYGNNIAAYPYLPGYEFVVGGDSMPRAQVWLFTTHVNPKSSTTPLTAVYRMSWKCTDPTLYYPTAACNSTDNKHVDTVLLAESEVAYFKSIGYKIDGIEGYVYPKTLPQPAGTTRLIRKYHPGRDDHAIFPETAWATMQAQGYTENTNTTDWLGYVYPSGAGNIPVIQ